MVISEVTETAIADSESGVGAGALAVVKPWDVAGGRLELDLILVEPGDGVFDLDDLHWGSPTCDPGGLSAHRRIKLMYDRRMFST